MKKLAIFASGSGSNAQRIAEYFAGRPDIRIELILTNRKDAFVIERAKKLSIPCIIFNRTDFYESSKIEELLDEKRIDYIVLAGFLWLVPPTLIKKYAKRMVNIHPALLPKYGGKGMFGHHVHEAVVANREKETGITIHYVNEHYDEGDIIFQARCTVDDLDTPNSVAARIHELEYEHFPRVIDELLARME